MSKGNPLRNTWTIRLLLKDTSIRAPFGTVLMGHPNHPNQDSVQSCGPGAVVALAELLVRNLSGLAEVLPPASGRSFRGAGLAYLRSGKTRKEKTVALFSGFPRGGVRPRERPETFKARWPDVRLRLRPRFWAQRGCRIEPGLNTAPASFSPSRICQFSRTVFCARCAAVWRLEPCCHRYFQARAGSDRAPRRQSFAALRERRWYRI